MAFGSRITACLLATAFVSAAFGAYKNAPQSVPVPDRHESTARTVRARFLSFRSLTAHVDTQVIANLLTDQVPRHNDLLLTVMAGEVARCELKTCSVPLTVRLPEAQGPVMLAFAVANGKGELSDIHHAECGTGTCNVSLILERGANTLSIGVLDGLTQSTAYTTLHVNAVRTIATSGHVESF